MAECHRGLFCIRAVAAIGIGAVGSRALPTGGWRRGKKPCLVGYNRDRAGAQFFEFHHRNGSSIAVDHILNAKSNRTEFAKTCRKSSYHRVVFGGLLSELRFVLPVPGIPFGTDHVLPPVVPTISPIGADLREIMTFVAEAIVRGGTPYIGTATYPPLGYVVLAPLLLIDPSQRYSVFSLITVVCYAAGNVVRSAEHEPWKKGDA